MAHGMLWAWRDLSGGAAAGPSLPQARKQVEPKHLSRQAESQKHVGLGPRGRAGRAGLIARCQGGYRQLASSWVDLRKEAGRIDQAMAGSWFVTRSAKMQSMELLRSSSAVGTATEEGDVTRREEVTIHSLLGTQYIPSPASSRRHIPSANHLSRGPVFKCRDSCAGQFSHVVTMRRTVV